MRKHIRDEHPEQDFGYQFQPFLSWILEESAGDILSSLPELSTKRLKKDEVSTFLGIATHQTCAGPSTPQGLHETGNVATFHYISSKTAGLQGMETALEDVRNFAWIMVAA